MSNYFFSLSSFIWYYFEFYLFNTVWYWMFILYIYINCCFILAGRVFFLFIYFFVPVSCTFLRSFISMNTFSLPRGTSHRDRSKYCGDIICMKRTIWFSTCHKMFTTNPSIVNLHLRLGQFSLFIAVIHFFCLSVVCSVFIAGNL